MAGKNIDTGMTALDEKAEASRLLYEAAKSSWENRKGKLGEILTPFDDFSGLRAVDVSKLPAGTFMGMGFDTIGTKTELAERLGKHDTIAYDMFAMVCDDAVVRGGEAVLIGSNLEINKIDLAVVRQLAKGYVGAAKEAGVAIINGEIAEVGSRVGGFGKCNYNWGASVIWFAKKEHMITGREIKAGQKIISFQEAGFRSNGFTLLRRVMDNSWTTKTLQQALTPSKIYSKAVVSMFGKANITGVAHITGGGIPEKLGRMLKASGLGADLTNLYEPGELMQTAIELGSVPISDAYRTWNMGNGMMITTSEPDDLIAIAKKYGLNAKICGEISNKKGIRLESYEDEKLVF